MHMRPDADLELFWNRQMHCHGSENNNFTYCVPWCFRPGCIDLFDFPNARRPMQFSPWFHTCIDFRVETALGNLMAIPCVRYLSTMPAQGLMDNQCRLQAQAMICTGQMMCWGPRIEREGNPQEIIT